MTSDSKTAGTPGMDPLPREEETPTEAFIIYKDGRVSGVPRMPGWTLPDPDLRKAAWPPPPRKWADPKILRLMMSGSMMFMHAFPPALKAAMTTPEPPKPAWVADLLVGRSGIPPGFSDLEVFPAASPSPLIIGGNLSQSPAEQGGVGRQVLVISSGIDDADGLAAAARNDVIVVRYDPATARLDTLAGRIRDALGGQRADRIAFAAHNAEGGRLILTREATFTSASLAENPAHQAFWVSVAGALTDAGRIDLLGCNVGRGAAGSELVSRLEALTGINVAASADPTGNPDQGGDWVLESDGVDAQVVYFDEGRIKGFESLLLGPVITPIDLTTSELGDTGAFTVRLDTPDTVDVSVIISSNDMTEGTVIDPPGGNLTFTITDWDIPQTVVMMGLDDALLDGDVTYSVTAEAFGGLYSGESSQVTLTNLDILFQFRFFMVQILHKAKLSAHDWARTSIQP